MADSNQLSLQAQEPFFLCSSYPVYFPFHKALTVRGKQLEDLLRQDIGSARARSHAKDARDGKGPYEPFTVVGAPSTTADANVALDKMDIDQESGEPEEPQHGHLFMAGLRAWDQEAGGLRPGMSKKMRTENGDIAYTTTASPLVDLFSELEDVVSGPRLVGLLNAAWKDDPLMTLKIIFNARSIHLGKASRTTFYRCAGWLAQHHPMTLVCNLQWLSRPVIKKKLDKTNKKDDVIMVEQEKPESDPARFDVRNGVAHGYWKDLLNLLALHVNGQLQGLANPRQVLNIMTQKGTKALDKEAARAKRYQVRDSRHRAAVNAFNSDPVYRALHVTVAHLFADQLLIDAAALAGDEKEAKRNISLCAKWAPTSGLFHDRHTFIASTIAELMYPVGNFGEHLAGTMSDEEKRTLYLKYAREEYRKTCSALRKHLEVVERDLSANTLTNIKYDRVPSIAMSNYARIFSAKDTERFDQYITKVAEGKANISGATLLPSTLISTIRTGDPASMPRGKKMTTPIDLQVQQRMLEMQEKVVDGQWKTLVQRIKDSGTMESAIAVCDVSGSMWSPRFPDGTCPIDTSLGLSLLLAEVTAPPFGGTFITFSTNPKAVKVNLNWSLSEKVKAMERSNWQMSTDFVAVFENLILPMALENKLKQEDMVKRIFVFSDMQFNKAERGSDSWTTSHERIKTKFAAAGYEMPELVFWNIAGGRAGYQAASTSGNPIAPKPVTMNELNTALVSGYSQGMLKMFLDNGSFEDPEDKDVAVVKESEDGEVVVMEVKRKMDPLSTVRKAVGHKAYEMLRVVD